jgi:surface protein
MENVQDVDFNFFTRLPYQTIIEILKQLLNQENGIEIFDRLLNTPNFHLINCLFAAKNKKSLCLMNTRLWLLILSSMGYDGESNTFIPENRRFTWDNSIIEYQRNVINQCLYTSRVHDLIDCLREGNQLAIFLLQRLENQSNDPYERNFLLGRQPIWDQIHHTNNTLSIFFQQWMRGQAEGPSIKYWDVRGVTNMINLFNLNNLRVPQYSNVLDLTYWDVSNVTDMSYMFNSFTCGITFIGMKNWNTCRVTNMDCLANNNIFNSDISNWDVSKVQNMNRMFYGATSFNQDISNWDTSRVTNMNEMFRGANNFNQNIGEWDTSKVENMSGLFQSAISFNSPLYKWNTSKVISMNQMFSGATNFNQNINKNRTSWNTRRVVNMHRMFEMATSFNQPLPWNTQNVEHMNDMFSEAISFDQDLIWNIRNLRFRRDMFSRSRGRLINHY